MRKILLAGAMTIACGMAQAGGAPPPSTQKFVLMVVFTGNTTTGNRVWFAPGKYTATGCEMAHNVIRNSFMNDKENKFNAFNAKCVPASDADDAAD